MLSKKIRTVIVITLIHAQSMEVGDHGAPTPPAAELVEEALRQELDLATIPVLHMEAHLVLDLLQTQVPVIQTRVQEMEIGDPGAPMAPAAELAVEAHGEELDLATTPVQLTEAHLVQDLPRTQDPATQTPALQIAAPTLMTGPAANPTKDAVKGTETATMTMTAAATWSVATTTAGGAGGGWTAVNSHQAQAVATPIGVGRL